MRTFLTMTMGMRPHSTMRRRSTKTSRPRPSWALSSARTKASQRSRFLSSRPKTCSPRRAIPCSWGLGSFLSTWRVMDAVDQGLVKATWTHKFAIHSFGTPNMTPRQPMEAQATAILYTPTATICSELNGTNDMRKKARIPP